MRDVRICAIGDSFVAGVGDPEHLGWVARLAASTHASGLPVTLYPLGVRRDTSGDVLARARRELGPRLPGTVDGRVVVSFGVNDTTAEEGSAVRVGTPESAATLAVLLGEIADAGWSALVVGPPPVADPAQTDRIVELTSHYADVCAAAGVAWCPMVGSLRDDPVWMDEVRAGDGSHPGAAGYARLAQLVAPMWRAWLAAPGSDATAAGAHPGSRSDVARGERPGPGQPAGPATDGRAELRVALGDLLTVADRIGDDALVRPTACAGWDARRLLEHLVGWQRVFAACLADTVPPFADGSPTYRASPTPVADLRGSAASLIDALGRRADPYIVVPYRGRTQVAEVVVELVAETVLHTWDLAVAVRVPTSPTAEVLAVAQRGLTLLLDEPFAPVAFASVPRAPGGAGLTELLARSGRDPGT